MSAAALFELNIIGIEPHHLFQKICDTAGDEGSFGSSIDLTKKSNSRISYSYDFWGHNTLNNRDKVAYLKKLLSENVQEKFEEYNPDVSYPPFCSLKNWDCFLGYYIDDDEDFEPFRRVVELLLKYSDGDIYYFREAEGQGHTEYGEAITLTADDLKKYPPDMCDVETYRIVAQ